MMVKSKKVTKIVKGGKTDKGIKMMVKSKKVTKIVKGGKTEQGLNQEQEAFCQLYINSDREFFGNGVQCYIEVYQPDKTQKGWYKAVCASSSRLLSNAKVIKRINELLEEGGLNDVNVDKQLSFLVSQYTDFGNKLGAIKEYNRLRSRVSDGDNININIGELSNDELIKLIKK